MFRIVGRRMDDAGAAIALSAVRHLGHRQCAIDKTSRRAMVLAVEIRTLARRQFRVTHTAFAPQCIVRSALPSHGNRNIVRKLAWCLLLTEDVNDALEDQAQ